MLGFEAQKGQAFALQMPDELTVGLNWKVRPRFKGGTARVHACHAAAAAQDEMRLLGLGPLWQPLPLCCNATLVALRSRWGRRTGHGGRSTTHPTSPSAPTHAHARHTPPPQDEKRAREYGFDAVFGPTIGQQAVFEDTRHLVQSALDGFNVCIFAYGQTGGCASRGGGEGRGRGRVCCPARQQGRGGGEGQGEGVLGVARGSPGGWPPCDTGPQGSGLVACGQTNACLGAPAGNSGLLVTSCIPSPPLQLCRQL
jgi:hypothetical protein